MSKYKLDRNAFKAQSFEEASRHVAYYKNLTWQDRLQISAYLNSVAFKYLITQPPRMDKSKFNASSRLK